MTREYFWSFMAYVRNTACKFGILVAVIMLWNTFINRSKFQSITDFCRIFHTDAWHASAVRKQSLYTDLHLLVVHNTNTKHTFLSTSHFTRRTEIIVMLNLLKPTGYVMHQQFNIQQLYVLPTLYLFVLYLSENKQQLVPLTA